MTGLVRRLFRWRRLRWLALGTAARDLLRRTATRSVDQATAELEDRLPDPVRRALQAVPADAARAGGSALVAARTARRVATGSRSASRVVGERRRRASDQLRRIRSIGDEIGAETERKRRELTADYLRASGDRAEADDALLDLRPGDAGSEEELPPIPEPVPTGRWRAIRRQAPAVNRVQRSYRPRTTPWSR